MNSTNKNVSITKSIVIAGTHSGTGKTTISIGIMAALRKRGFSIQPFKVGPDFIDPGYHEAVCGIPSRNLDGWMLDKKYNLETFLNHSQGKDISIIEGVMGLYDGHDGKSEDGSTAQIAKWAKSPVLLVIDARSMARSVAAVLYGFEKYDKKVTIAGVILNRVSSLRHYTYLKDAIEGKCKAKVIGYLPSDSLIEIPERHLGLVTSKENILRREYIKRLTNLIEKFIDIPRLLKIASPIERKRRSLKSNIDTSTAATDRKVKIGVAYDNAFCFYYQDNFDLLKKMGAELVYFSPLKDTSLPPKLDGIYLGGGYPELFAGDLEKNQAMRKEIRMFAEAGGCIYAECGGLMYLGKKIRSFNNRDFKMVGFFPFTAKMETKLSALGYYTVKAVKDTILAKKGEVIKGHQFRYSTLEKIPSSLRRSYQLSKGSRSTTCKEGYVSKNVLASFVHLHFGSNSKSANHFIDSCRKGKKKG
jgi:cobyrinic acid a,c-diamide synthase